MGKCQFFQISDQFYNFITNNLPKFGISQVPFSDDYFRELIKNAYDSYALRGLNYGEFLQIKVVISKKDNSDEIVIKVKDNGKGFSTQSQQRYFNRDQILKDKKPRDALGGGGFGLNNFLWEVRKKGGIVQFKNRKDKGAAVYIKLTQASLSSPDQLVEPIIPEEMRSKIEFDQKVDNSDTNNNQTTSPDQLVESIHKKFLIPEEMRSKIEFDQKFNHSDTNNNQITAANASSSQQTKAGVNSNPQFNNSSYVITIRLAIGTVGQDSVKVGEELQQQLGKFSKANVNNNSENYYKFLAEAETSQLIISFKNNANFGGPFCIRVLKNFLLSHPNINTVELVFPTTLLKDTCLSGQDLAILPYLKHRVVEIRLTQKELSKTTILKPQSRDDSAIDSSTKRSKTKEDPKTLDDSDLPRTRIFLPEHNWQLKLPVTTSSVEFDTKKENELGGQVINLRNVHNFIGTQEENLLL
ncbi:MAG: ATP-binding protein [Legionellales bacterium]|nr:ATP-binding protein [Legionellales bacterium]